MTIDEVKRHLLVISDDVLGNDMVDLYEAQNCCDTSFSIGYNKAIDDFSELLRETRDNRTLRVNCDDLEIRHMTKRLRRGDRE